MMEAAQGAPMDASPDDRDVLAAPNMADAVLDGVTHPQEARGATGHVTDRDVGDRGYDYSPAIRDGALPRDVPDDYCRDLRDDCHRDGHCRAGGPDYPGGWDARYDCHRYCCRGWWVDCCCPDVKGARYRDATGGCHCWEH